MSRQISARVNQERELKKTIELQNLDIDFENGSDSFITDEEIEFSAEMFQSDQNVSERHHY